MEAPPKAGALSFVISLVFGNGFKKAPDFQCPKCRTEVKTPPAVLMLHLETLEDYRRNCAEFVAATSGGKQLMGGFWSEERQNQLDQHERFVRILDAMTPEERESSE